MDIEQRIKIEHRYYGYAATGIPAGYWPDQYNKDQEALHGPKTLWQRIKDKF